MESLCVVMTTVTCPCYRPLIAAEFSPNLLTGLLLHVLSVPAITQHIATMAPDVSSN